MVKKGGPAIVHYPEALKRALNIAGKWERKPKLNSWKIVRGDKVAVNSGREKGKQGIVVKVIRKQSRVIIKGLNTRNRKVPTGPADQYTGEIPKKWTRVESPIHVSNCMLIDPETGKPTRTHVKKLNGKKVRVAVKSGAIVPKPEASQIYVRKTDVNDKTDTSPEMVLVKTYKPPPPLDPDTLAKRLAKLGVVAAE